MQNNVTFLVTFPFLKNIKKFNINGTLRDFGQGRESITSRPYIEGYQGFCDDSANDLVLKSLRMGEGPT